MLSSYILLAGVAKITKQRAVMDFDGAISRQSFAGKQWKGGTNTKN